MFSSRLCRELPSFGHWMYVCKVSRSAQIPAKIPIVGNLEDVRLATRLLLLHLLIGNTVFHVRAVSRECANYLLCDFSLQYAACTLRELLDYEFSPPLAPHTAWPTTSAAHPGGAFREGLDSLTCPRPFTDLGPAHEQGRREALGRRGSGGKKRLYLTRCCTRAMRSVL